MKKIAIGFLILVLASFIIGITVQQLNNNKKVDEFTFDGETFEYLSIDDEDIKTYRSDSYDMDIKKEEESMTIFFEKDDDIYIIETDYENVSIRLNGSMVSICQREGRTCSGFESIGLEDDIFDLINELE